MGRGPKNWEELGLKKVENGIGEEVWMEGYGQEEIGEVKGEV